jgi:general secretion pathway protein I
MPRPRTAQRGFTLIEVLVALTIVAIALSAAVRASSLMTENNSLLQQRALALLAAQSRLAEIRLQRPQRTGRTSTECDQGRLKLRCEQWLQARENLLLVRLEVRQRGADGPPLAHVQTLIRRPGAAPSP